MKAMILAAGRGERMRPLTEHTPKPLLYAGGKALIEYHLENLAAAGVKDVIINIAYLGEQIRQHLGSGEQWQLTIHYSAEPEPLETAGALLHAMPLLGHEPFLLINGDVWTDYPLKTLLNYSLDKNCLGHLVLVNNPAHNSQGDFSIHQHLLTNKKNHRYTFSGISLLSPDIIHHYPDCRHRFPLGEVFRYYIDKQQLSGEVYQGEWRDIGTVERLDALDALLR